jgi:adenylosuccinate synthase
VGAGPFPTELEDATGEAIRERGKEFGTTTGRPRRCGWLDAVGLRYASMVNAVDEFALTKLDVLTGINPLRIARKYMIDGTETERFPARIEDLEEVEPVYEEMEGWEADICGARKFDDLPETCRRYVQAVEEIVGVRASMISVGYNREDTIMRAGGD